VATVGEVRDRIIELARADDLVGFKQYMKTEFLEIYGLDPKSNLACDLRGLCWALAKGWGVST